MKFFYKTLKDHYKNKYQRALSNKQYIITRYQNLNQFLNYKNILIKKNNKKKLVKKFILTNDFLLRKFNHKQKSDYKTFLILYKKFSYSLKLKTKYDKNFKKMTNKETHYSSYVYLGNHLIKTDQINELQKLNIILKINDLTLLNFKKNIDDFLIYHIKKNINFEKKIVMKYAKKFINYSS